MKTYPKKEKKKVCDMLVMLVFCLVGRGGMGRGG